VALLRKETCNLRHPEHLRHPVQRTATPYSTLQRTTMHCDIVVPILHRLTTHCIILVPLPQRLTSSYMALQQYTATRTRTHCNTLYTLRQHTATPTATPAGTPTATPTAIRPHCNTPGPNTAETQVVLVHRSHTQHEIPTATPTATTHCHTHCNTAGPNATIHCHTHCNTPGPNTTET